MHQVAVATGLNPLPTKNESTPTAGVVCLQIRSDAGADVLYCYAYGGDLDGQ